MMGSVAKVGVDDVGVTTVDDSNGAVEILGVTCSSSERLTQQRLH